MSPPSERSDNGMLVCPLTRMCPMTSSQRYGPILSVNLVNKTGKEAALGKLFMDIVQHLKASIAIQYDASCSSSFSSFFSSSHLSHVCRSIWFDFHVECRSDWGKLASLLQHMAAHRSSHGFTLIDAHGHVCPIFVIRTQCAIPRVLHVQC